MRATAISATCAAVALLASGAVSVGARPRARASGGMVIRVNQVGYETAGHKLAYVLAPASLAGVRVQVVRTNGSVALTVRSHRRCGSWNAHWRGCEIIDFSTLRSAGTYRLRAGRAISPSFVLGSGAALYGPLSTRAVQFLQAQRDGSQVVPGVLTRRPAHLTDASARVYALPAYRHGQLAGSLKPAGRTVDIAGGWFDAGDYLKLTGTASFTDLILLFTLREYGAKLPAPLPLLREARFGTDWLLKTWDANRRVLYEQVGLGDGNGGSVLGDHDLWRLPQRDDGYRGRSLRFIAHRPVFAANRPGAPVSPNLAGREAAAFALCAQVFRLTDPPYAHRCLLAGQTLYSAAAKSWTGRLAGSVPASYYPESEWRDDMELAAIELYLATVRMITPDLPNRNAYAYLDRASYWADQYMSQPRGGGDALNLYDVEPLAQYDLYRTMLATGHTTDLYVNASDVRGDLHDQLSLASRLARTGPLGLADPATPEDTVAHALGYAAEARLYAALGGRQAYASLARGQLDWVLGANPWGASFIVGAGSTFPRCPAHQVANLSGSHDGRAPILAGAAVEGPTGASSIGALGAPDGYRRCSADARSYGSFDGRGFRYLDDVRSSSTSEPTDDITVLSLLAFAQEAAGAPHAAGVPHAAGDRAAASSPRGHWLTGVTISEYWPVPETWFRGKLVSAPGISGKHRVDWLYSGTGLVMEGDGISRSGQRVHVANFGNEQWVNARGQRTKPTPSGVWTHGDPAWRVGGWRTATGAVTFPLQTGGWSRGPGIHYSPVPGVRFALGPSLRLKPYYSVAVDPRLIPPGSRIYIPVYRRVNGGWFLAQDTGSGIIGPHIDVYRLPPPTVGGGRFLERQRVLRPRRPQSVGRTREPNAVRRVLPAGRLSRQT